MIPENQQRNKATHTRKQNLPYAAKNSLSRDENRTSLALQFLTEINPEIPQ